MPLVATCRRCQATISLSGPIDLSRPLRCPACLADITPQLDLEQAPNWRARRSMNPDRGACASPPDDWSAWPEGGPGGPSFQTDASQAHAYHSHRKRQPGLLSQLVGVVGGGILGLAIGYYLLNRIGGPQYNFLNIPLPGVTAAPEEQSSVEGHESEVVADPGNSSQIHLPAPQVLVAEGASPDEVQPPEVSPQQIAAPQLVPLRPDLMPRPNRPVGTVGHESPVVTLLSAVDSRAAAPGAAGFHDGPTYRMDELTAAVAAASDACTCPSCKGTGLLQSPAVRAKPKDKGSSERLKVDAPVCSICRGRGMPLLGASEYERLCQLAEIATFVDAQQAGDALPEARQAVTDILSRVASTRDQQGRLGRRAVLLLDQQDASEKGICLAGSVMQTVERGKLDAVDVLLFGAVRTATVMGPSGADFKPGDHVIILGRVVTQPQTELDGYKGPNETVVWGGFRGLIAHTRR